MEISSREAPDGMGGASMAGRGCLGIAGGRPEDTWIIVSMP